IYYQPWMATVSTPNLEKTPCLAFGICAPRTGFSTSPCYEGSDIRPKFCEPGVFPGQKKAPHLTCGAICDSSTLRAAFRFGSLRDGTLPYCGEAGRWTPYG